MSKSIYLTILASLLFLLQNIHAQQLNDQMLIKKWRIEVVMNKHVEHLHDTHQELYEQLDREKRAKIFRQIQAQANQNSFEFKPDHRFELHLNERQLQTGTWQLDAQQAILTLTYESGRKESLKISEASKRKLLLTFADKEVVLEALN